MEKYKKQPSVQGGKAVAGVAGRYNLGLATDETGGEKKAKCGSKKVVFVGQPWLLPPSECPLVVPTPPRNRSMSHLTHKFPRPAVGSFLRSVYFEVMFWAIPPWPAGVRTKRVAEEEPKPGQAQDWPGLTTRAYLNRFSPLFLARNGGSIESLVGLGRVRGRPGRRPLRRF